MVGERDNEIAITDITWDEDAEAHIHVRHGVSHDDIQAVLARSNYLAFRNLPDRGGSHVIIGPDERGRVLYISIRQTDQPGVWEPVSAWESRVARRIWREARGEA